MPTVDTLVLGCTHYPLLARTIGDVMGRDVVLVSSADETAFAVRDLLHAPTLRAVPDRRVTAHVFLTSGTGRYFPARSARGSSVPRSSRVDGVVVELTVLGVLGVVRRAGGRRVQRLPVRGRHVDLDRLRQRHVRRTCRSTSRPRDLTAVVITHGHPDHCVDIYGLHVLLRYGLGSQNLPVYAPEGLEKFLLSLVSDWGNTFDWRVVGDGDTATVGDVDLRSRRTDHPPPTFAVEATPTAGG